MYISILRVDHVTAILGLFFIALACLSFLTPIYVSYLKTPMTCKENTLSADYDPWCDEDNPRVCTYDQVTAAAYRIKDNVLKTPCRRSHLSTLLDVELFLKCETQQFTGCFKERGACNAIKLLGPEERKNGVIAASAGNHAQAMAYHGRAAGLPSVVVMPLVAPMMKVQKCHELGAEVIVQGATMKDAKFIAMGMGAKRGMAYINGYDHPHVLAGQGTLGLELAEQVPDLDAVIIPIGGGSLMGGSIAALSHLKPHVKFYGVESEKVASFKAALEAGKPVFTEMKSTIADGLSVPVVGYNSYATVSPLITKTLTVTEEAIARAILRLLEVERMIVEGAGACPIALLMSGKVPELKKKKVVAVLTGGNIDTTVLGRCVDRGLASDDRLIKFKVTLLDRPGGMYKLTSRLAKIGLSMKEIFMEKSYTTGNIFNARMKVVCEARSGKEYKKLKQMLEAHYEDYEFGNLVKGEIKGQKST